MGVARHLHSLPVPRTAPLFDRETGQILEEACSNPECQERADQVEGLKKTTASQAGTITSLKRDLARMQGVEPDSAEIRGVLEYARDQLRPGAKIIPASAAWKKVKERLAEIDVDGNKVFTAGQLKLAVDGVKLSRWHVEKGYIKPETVFRDADAVQAHVDRAIDYQARLAPILKLPVALFQANLDYLADRCLCGCLRIEHPTVHGDRETAGLNPCLRCVHCRDFDDIMVRCERWKAEQ